jgi:hypothetical protein
MRWRAIRHLRLAAAGLEPRLFGANVPASDPDGAAR